MLDDTAKCVTTVQDKDPQTSNKSFDFRVNRGPA